MKRKKILVAPLDWGIGHATRCIPIINALLTYNYKVVIAADKGPLHLLKNEFPNLEFIRLSGYNIKYSLHLPMNINMLLQLPKLFLKIKKENKILTQIVQDYKIDGVISDNRYGLYHSGIPCIFITHQLKIQSPYFEKFIQNLNYKYINRYHQCWIVDSEKDNIAGKLSKPEKLPINHHYIGILSRFKQNIKTSKTKYKYLGIVSGPEPQRSVFANRLIKSFKNKNEKTLILLGNPEEKRNEKIGSLTIKSHLIGKELNEVIQNSEIIICRPGYSTIMDLLTLDKKAFFIPTPGQTEQEYLATRFLKKKMFYMQKQSEFNLNLGLEKMPNYNTPFSITKEEKNWEELFSLF
jgi:uncharacterized protein (TIGR00661 family)